MLTSKLAIGRGVITTVLTKDVNLGSAYYFVADDGELVLKQSLTLTVSGHLRNISLPEEEGFLLPRLTGDITFKCKPEAKVTIKSSLIGRLNFGGSPIISQGTFRALRVDKFAGTFKDYQCVQKLYPSGDIITSVDGSYFVNEINQSGNLYQSIDEGVYTGSYHTQSGRSDLISDDLTTFITPSAVQTEGYFRYKCAVAKPITAIDSTFVMRATAPLQNRLTQTPPQYTLQNIKLEDPSGDLLIHYDDIVIRGDADLHDVNNKNWATYASQPKENRYLLNFWDSLYPKLEDAAGYTLNFDVTVQDFDDPFDGGFSLGFEENDVAHITTTSDSDYLSIGGSPVGAMFQGVMNPTNSLRISAIEICNSGAYDIAAGDRLNMFLEVQPTGNRLQRCVKPTSLKLATFDNGIWPTSSSVWQDGTASYTNETTSGANYLLGRLTSEDLTDYISLQSTFGVPDSGKLVLEFGHNHQQQYLGSWMVSSLLVFLLVARLKLLERACFRPLTTSLR